MLYELMSKSPDASAICLNSSPTSNLWPLSLYGPEDGIIMMRIGEEFGRRARGDSGTKRASAVLGERLAL